MLTQLQFIYLFIHFIFHNKDYTNIKLYNDVARGPQETTRLVRGGPLVTIILSNRSFSRDVITVQNQKLKIHQGFYPYQA